MVRKWFPLFILVLFAALPIAFGGPSTHSLTIIYSNNLFGSIEPSGWGKSRSGGLARRATFIKEARKKAENLLVLDAGDLLLPKLPNFLSINRRNQLAVKADVIIEAFNQMGCDGVSVGDTDLALGKDFLLKMAQRAKFPFISSNIIDKETGKPAFKPYIIREMNGLRMGIISLISKDVLDKREGQALEEFGLQDPYLTAETIVAELRDQTDFIILLSHQGHQANRQFAKRVKGINIIVGGHTGVPLYNPHVVNETLILQNSAYGRNIGSIDIEFSRGKVSFANADIMKSVRETLRGVEKKIRSLEEQEPGKQGNEALASTLGYKDILEKKLQTYGQKNPFRNRIVRLDKRIPSDPDVLALVEGCKRKLADLTKKKKTKGCGSDPQS